MRHVTVASAILAGTFAEGDTVTVDGVTLGHPTYNQNRIDIATAFLPGGGGGGSVAVIVGGA